MKNTSRNRTSEKPLSAKQTQEIYTQLIEYCWSKLTPKRKEIQRQKFLDALNAPVTLGGNALKTHKEK